MATTANDVVQGLAQGIIKIADQRISNLKLDKTVSAKVEKVLSDGKYSLSYNGGTMYAYAAEGYNFMPGASVLVLVPQGDFSKEKTIIGRSSGLVESTGSLSGVASSIDRYSIIGNNILQFNSNKEDNEVPYRISSFGETVPETGYQQLMILYRNDIESKNNYINVDTNGLNAYIKDSTAFLFGAKFKTRLPSNQIYKNVGNYGLILTIKIKNDGAVYENHEAEWAALEPQTSLLFYDNKGEINYKRLNNYRTNIEQILKITEIDTDDSCYDARVTNVVNPSFRLVRYIFNKIEIELEKLEGYMQTASSRLDEASYNLILTYYTFIQELLNYTTDENGNYISRQKVLNAYNNWFKEPVSAAQYQELVYEYDLDTNYMVGNPYSFNDYSYQYLIQTVDPEHFVGITGIYFFCRDFIGQDNTKVNNNLNIAVKDLEFYCLEDSDEDTGDYKLSLEYPDGAVFNSQLPSDNITVNGKFTFIPQSQDYTHFCHFRWFKEDKTVTSSESSGYSNWAGTGWRLLNGIASVSSFTFNAAQCKAYENTFLCVATYDLQTTLRKEFKIYNKANQRQYEITCDKGFNFMPDGKETKTLICEVDGQKTISGDNLEFIWSKTIGNQTLIFEKTYEEYQQEIDDLKANMGNSQEPVADKLKILENKRDAVKGFDWDKNVLKYPQSQISKSSNVTVSCTIYYTEFDEETETKIQSEIGNASAILKYKDLAYLQSYYINIVNGDQVFQYSESGVSPASERYENPYILKDLQCEFYKPGGGIIANNKYKVSWQWPLDNTMLVIDPELASENPVTGVKDTYKKDTCPINILDNYVFNSVNNQITCLVEYDDVIYKETTNFYFGKIGENGTNGTDVVAKISPIVETTNTVLQNELLTLIHYDYASNAGVDDEYVDPIEDVCKWNYGEDLDTDVLKLELYRRNELIPIEQYKNVRWSINSNTSKVHSRMSVKNSVLDNLSDKCASISYIKPSINETTTYYHNYIVEASAALELTDENGDTAQQNYYYNYPIPVILDRSKRLNELAPAANYVYASIGIDKNLTMRQVLYNAEGRCPQYNENQGVKLLFKNTTDRTDSSLGLYEIEWSVGGGVSTAEEDSSVLRIYDPNTKKKVNSYTTWYCPLDESTQDIENLQYKKAQIQENWNITKNKFIADWKECTRITEDGIVYPKENISQEVIDKIYDDYVEKYNKYLSDLNKIEDEIAKVQIKSVDFVKIVPQDIYTGEYNNNFVKALVYKVNKQAKQKITDATQIIQIEEDANYDVPTESYIYDSHNNIINKTVTTIFKENEVGIAPSGDLEETEIYYSQKTNKILVAKIIVPIYCSLNTYGLSHINSWDGNSIEINEDEKYILAPQMGAGEKHIEDNTFTGLVMGVEKRYDEDNQIVKTNGLHGYHHGKQSIFLDAETGNATFGLPEDDAVDAGNPLTEGRIELRPGGTSKIARWRFDSRSLYRVVSKNQTDASEELNSNRLYTENNSHKSGEILSDGTLADNFESLAQPYKSIKTHFLEPGTTNVYKNSDAAPKNAHGSIPHDQQGILLSAVPAYVSVKGRPLDKDDGIDFSKANTDVKEGDTLEVELNPNTRSVFGIYNHMRKTNGNNVYVDAENHLIKQDKTDKKYYRIDADGNYLTPRQESQPVWFRILKAGIDESGRFFSNALQAENTTAIIGYVGAFGIQATDEKYIGASWDFKEADTLIKFFTKVEGLNESTPLYISSSAKIPTPQISSKDEGLRPIGIYGGDYINLYAGDNENEISPTQSFSSLIINNPYSNGATANPYIILGSYGEQDTNGQFTSFKNKKYNNIAELVMRHTTTVSSNPEKLAAGHFYHSSGWNTKIGDAYSATYLGTYNKNVSSTAAMTYQANYSKTVGSIPSNGAVADSISTITHNGELRVKVRKKITVTHSSENGLVYQNRSTPTSATTWGDLINDIQVVPKTGTGDIPIKMLHQGSGQIQLMQQYVPATKKQGNKDVALTANEKASFDYWNKAGSSAGQGLVKIGSIGNESSGISFYTKDSALDDTSHFSFMNLLPGSFEINISGAKDASSGAVKGVNISNHGKDFLLHITSGIFTKQIFAASNDNKPDSIKDGDIFANQHIVCWYGDETKYLPLTSTFADAYGNKYISSPLTERQIGALDFKSYSDLATKKINGKDYKIPQHIVSLKDHTHPFSKGVTIKVKEKNSGAPTTSIVQGDVGSNAEITVNVAPQLNGSAYTATNGEVTSIRLYGSWHETFPINQTLYTDGETPYTGGQLYTREVHDSSVVYVSPGSDYNRNGLVLSLIEVKQEAASGGCNHTASIVTGSDSETVKGESGKPTSS